MATFFRCTPWLAAFAIWKRLSASFTRQPCSQDWYLSRSKGGAECRLAARSQLDLLAGGVCAGLSAGDFGGTTSTVDASYRRAVGRCVPCDIEIDRVTRLRRQLRTPEQGESSHHVERGFRLVPFDACVLDPEIGVVRPTPIRH